MAASSYFSPSITGSTAALYEMHRAGSHGWGLIATQDIPTGTHILHEKAIWRIKCSIRNQDRKLLQSFRQLSPEMQDTILHLSGGYKDATESRRRLKTKSREEAAQKLRTILKCNSKLEDGGDESEEGDCFAIYPEIARLNHSCAPNCELMPVALAERRLIASKDIKAHEELTICYVDPCESYDRREAFLADAFDFTTACKCPVCLMCELDADYLKCSDNRREQLNAGQEMAEDYLYGLGNPPDFAKYSEDRHRDMYRLCKTMVKLATEEKILGASAAPMYQVVSFAAKGLGWEEKAVKYKTKTMEVARRFLMV